MYGINNYIYGANEFHKILINDVLGSNGENLTIMVLTYNRSSATAKLLNSIQEQIPNFLGEVLIIDNKSDKTELDKIKKLIKNLSIKVRIIELDKNYGVAGGRNRGIDYVETSWVMSLDNDIYLVGNPIQNINEALKLLGCHFLNIPLMDEKGENYFFNGGHLYVDTDGEIIDVGGGSLFQQISINEYENNEPSLSTFFAGGTSVFKKDTFLKMGKYDDEYFIGFEDTDFSLRLFESGYKIGNCVGSFLIHNHVIDNNAKSIKYEKNRFSSDIIYKSAMHFEDKWGYRAWNKNVALWLEQRQRDLNVLEKNIKNKYREKPSIALVADVYNWCFWNISKQLEKYLKNKFDIEIVVMENYDNIYEALIYLKKFDLVHFFWRGSLLAISEENDNIFVQKYGISYEFFKNEILDKICITTSVYDHLYLDTDFDNTKRILNIASEYTTSSNILNNIYMNIDNIKKPIMTITDGVDLDKFYPINKEKYVDIKKRKIIFGWVGNSAWNQDEVDFKGFNTIIKPALQELIDEGYPIETYFADKQIRQIPFDKMNEYYNCIDVLLCASKAEGTPNPVLEAMASGTVVISTNVGIVPDALGKKQKKYILKERTKDDLKIRIKKLIENLDEFEQLKEENLNRIKNWNWEIKANEFGEFFTKCLEKSNNNRTI